MSGASDVAQALVVVADQIDKLHTAMSAAPWASSETGGDSLIPESVQVETGADHWVAYPNDDQASLSHRDDGEGVLSYPEPVTERIRLDARGIVTCRNRLGDVVALLRLAAEEITRLRPPAR